VAWLPARTTPFYVVTVLVASVGVLSLWRPQLLVAAALLAGALSGLIHGIDSQYLASTGGTIQGALWNLLGLCALGIGIFYLGRLRLPLYYYLIALFAAWAALRLLVGTPTRAGFRHLLLYLLPLGLMLYTAIAVNRSPRRTVLLLQKTLMAAAFIPAFLYLVLVPIGLIRLTPHGPYGLVNPRPTALFLLTVLPFSLAYFRYAPTRRARRLGLAASLASGFTILFTLSRTASLIALLMVALFKANPSKPYRWVIRGGVALAIGLAILLAIPQFRGRFFEEPDLSSVDVTSIRLSERNIVWPAVAVKASQRPLVGLGLGTARVTAGNVVPSRDEIYPHNEYLQIWHDMGVVGLILLLLTWISVLSTHLTRWRAGHVKRDSTAAQWNLAAVLLACVVLISALTDNTLHYAFLIGPIFVVLGTAQVLGRALDRNGTVIR